LVLSTMFDVAVAALVVLTDEVQAACTGALILVVAAAMLAIEGFSTLSKLNELALLNAAFHGFSNASLTVRSGSKVRF
jgi:hypothetical protein